MLPAQADHRHARTVTRTVRDAAIVLDVIAGYDPNDPVTAYAVGTNPISYTSFLGPNGLKGARIGVIRQPMDAKTDPTSADYRKVRTVIDKAIGDLRMLGAEIIDPVEIPDAIERVKGPTTATCSRPNRLSTSISRSTRTLQRSRYARSSVRESVPSRVRVLMNSRR